jgi:hypothetical protein
MNFKEPISTFAYNLVSLHHDVMWYVIIIITLVYWCIYKVLKEFTWNSFNKLEGFLLFTYLKTFINIQIRLIFLIFHIYYFFLKISSYFFISIAKRLDYHLIKENSFLGKIYIYILGKNIFKGFTKKEFYRKEKYFSDFQIFKNLLIERFLNTYLFSKPTNALYYYEGFDGILYTLKFRHSINLEYVFGFFPTLIIGIIIVPSMYLLYSNESDVDPGLTVKIIGNQWYWNYEGSSNHLLKDDGKRVLIDYKFDSVIVSEENLVKGGKRLLETDNVLVLPYNVVIRFLIHLLMFYMLELYQNWVLK